MPSHLARLLPIHALKERLPRAFWSHYALPAGLLVIAFLLRLPQIAFPGFGHDPQYYGVWAQLAEKSFFHVYSASVQLAGPKHLLVPGSYANYPPGMMLFLLLICVGYQIVVGIATGVAPFAVPFDTAGGAALITLKIVFVCCDMLTAWLMYHFVRKRASPGVALVAMCIYAFSPAVLYDVGVWGQSDGVVALFLMGMFWQLQHQRPLLASTILGLTIMMKLQMIALIPIFFIWLFFSYGNMITLRASGIISAILVTLLGPFAIAQAPGQQGRELQVFIDNVLYIQHLNNYNSWTAFNLWWLLGVANQPSDRPLVGALNGSQIGIALFALCVVVVAVCLWLLPRIDALIVGTAIIAFAFFFVTTTQHERYLFPALLPMILFRPQSLRVLLAAIIAQFTVFINIFFTHMLPQPLLPSWFVPNTWPYSLTSVISWINLCIFLALFVEMGMLVTNSPLARRKGAPPTRLLPHHKRRVDVTSMHTKRSPELAQQQTMRVPIQPPYVMPQAQEARDGSETLRIPGMPARQPDKRQHQTPDAF